MQALKTFVIIVESASGRLRADVTGTSFEVASGAVLIYDDGVLVAAFASGDWSGVYDESHIVENAPKAADPAMEIAP